MSGDLQTSGREDAGVVHGRRRTQERRPLRARARDDAGAPSAARLAPPVALLVLGSVLVWGLRHQIGLDGLSYLSLAEYVASGRFDLALNAYWSPLLPWLTAPLLLLGVPSIVAGHVVVLGSALAALEAMRRLCVRIGVPPGSVDLVCVAAVPVLLAMVALGVFADLLLAALLLTHLSLVLAPSWVARPGRAYAAGVVAGLAILAKTYALPFVVTVLVLLVALHRLQRPPTPLRNTLAASGRVLLAAALVVTPWVTALSLQAGSPTLSRAAGYNVQLVAPDSPGNPIRWAGLLPVAHDDAISVWEDPSAMTVPGGWQSTGTSQASRRLAENLHRNARLATVTVLEQIGALLVAAVAGALVVRWRRRSDRWWLPRAGLLGAAAIGLGGYLPLWLEERYLWLPLLAVMPFVGLALAAVPDRDRGTTRPGRVSFLPRRPLQVGAAVVLTLLLAVPAAGRITAYWGEGEDAARAAVAVRDRGLVVTDLASASNWQRSAVLCHHLGCRYHGIPLQQEPTSLRDELRRGGVGTYLVWEPGPDAVLPPAARRSVIDGALLLDLD